MTDQESKAWTHKGLPFPQIFKVQNCAGKFMATVFCGEKDILLLESIPHELTRNGPSSVTISRNSRKRIAGKRWGKLDEVILLLQSNAMLL